MMTEREVKKKWITLSLIEDILLDTIVIANFEYYSATVRAHAAPVLAPAFLARIL